ncbi:VOC family protein [Dyadobacter subterraneus]|uniref:VOC family protein n=1 Tax=Dyadobacter subterraneus TaxID=2773304 RepID=A0ABR9W546_9BACT|nr:VOC family protein [Dyadobacter subterraneus]MBE9460575.1 VOC family protein [Dyadobacter subterraneus]
MPKLTSAATILLVKDVIYSVNWYTNKLGFSNAEFYGNPAECAIIERDENYIMLSQADPELFKSHRKAVKKTNKIFFWVDDIEELYNEFRDKDANIGYELYLAPWGGKEFGINDPDEYDIFFGESFKVINPFCMFRL